MKVMVAGIAFVKLVMGSCLQKLLKKVLLLSWYLLLGQVVPLTIYSPLKIFPISYFLSFSRAGWGDIYFKDIF